MMEMDMVLDFLCYGGDSASIAALPMSCTAPFLPSLAVLGLDSSQSSLLTSLTSSCPLAASAIAYASLDFSLISEALLFCSTESPQQPDESICFEYADSKERAKNVLLSLQRRAMDISRRLQSGNSSEETWQCLQRRGGSFWDDYSRLPELICLLSVAVSRCPMLLHPEDIVWGLLPTDWGYVLLSFVLLNNPLLARSVLMLLGEFLSSQSESFPLAKPTSPESALQPVQCSRSTIAGLTQDQGQKDLPHCTKQAVLTILQLSKESTSFARMCREVLIVNHVCAAVALYLTAESIHDELPFLSKIIFSDRETSLWMLDYFKTAQKDSPLADLIGLIKGAEPLHAVILGSCDRKGKEESYNHLEGIFFKTRKALLAEARRVKEDFGCCGQLQGHLRLYCVLIHSAGLEALPEERDFWLTSLSETTGPRCKEMVELAMSFFCLVPGLCADNASRSLFQQCVSAVFKRKAPAGKVLSSELEELLVWLSVQLLLGHFCALALVVKEALGIHVRIPSPLVQELHDAAMSVGIISDPTVLMQAVCALRPKGPISSKSKNGNYSLQCLEQLLESGHLSRAGVDISGAVQHCISASTTPVHKLVIQIIQAYAEAPAVILQGIGGSRVFRMPSLSYSFLEASMVKVPSTTPKEGTKDDGLELTIDSLVREALASYYILCWENVLRRMGEGSMLACFTSLPISEGSCWARLIYRIPFHQLLQHMERNWVEFEELFPKWLSLAATLFPERFHVPDLLQKSHTRLSSWSDEVVAYPSVEFESWICGWSLSSSSFQTPKRFTVSTIDQARQAVGNALVDPLPALQLLKQLTLHSRCCDNTGQRELLEYQMLIIKQLVPKLLDPRCKQCLHEGFCSWFKSFEQTVTQMLLPTFVEVIFDMTSKLESERAARPVTLQLKALLVQSHTTRMLTYNNLVQQPLTLLACKPEVYRTPLLSLLLDVVCKLCTINRRVCSGIVSKELTEEHHLKEEEVGSAILAQDSAMCQVLLEACLPCFELDDIYGAGSLLECRKMVCGFLASLLETNQPLLKLLHFQGYDSRLVPMMVQGIPAMLQCLDFLHELLQQQNESKQVFAIDLIANIACAHTEYPRSLAMVQEAIAHIQDKASSTASFLQRVIGAMVQCACAFSNLKADVISILQECLRLSGPHELSGLPCHPMLHASTISAFQHLAHQSTIGMMPTL